MHILLAVLLLALPALAQGPVPTTIEDFHAPGTQPNRLLTPIYASINCTGCHSGYDPDQEPYERWAASMKAQSARDPIFHAALAIANQDAAGSGEYCLRCHAPGAWLDGRSTPPDGSALNNGLGDFDGVTCHVCHRMVDPFPSAENPDIDERVLLYTPELPVTPNNAQLVIDPQDVRRGPYDLGPNFFYHDWRESPFHRESLMCASCHDLSNPTLSKQPDGTYQLNTLNQRAPSQDKRDLFPVERTYEEWFASQYARLPVDTRDATHPTGRFGGNKYEVQSCQDCHMPDTTGQGCAPIFGQPVRSDLPLHNFNGSNNWVLLAVRALWPDNETGLTDNSVTKALQRTAEMHDRASDMQVSVDAGQLRVRVVNQTGHKLPTGYSEGRRIWLTVRWFDGSDNLLSEIGGYDPATAVLDTTGAKVYEGELGLDATQAAATGRPVGKSFNFVLVNTWLKDNRIPPRGFTNSGFASGQASPVGATYAEEQYWDETSYAIPAGAARAEVLLRHQTTTKEYIEFLRDTNTTDSTGATAYNQWVLHGRSAPSLLDSASIQLGGASALPPIDYGVGKTTSLGARPRLSGIGEARVSGAGFALRVEGAVPNSQVVVKSSTSSASIAFNGGTLYLGAGQAIVGRAMLDATGGATLPVSLAGLGGQSRNYQAFFRDAGASQAYGMTNGLHVRYAN